MNLMIPTGRIVGFNTESGQTRWGRVFRVFFGQHLLKVRDIHTNSAWFVSRADIHTLMPETY